MKANFEKIFQEVWNDLEKELNRIFDEAEERISEKLRPTTSSKPKYHYILYRGGRPLYEWPYKPSREQLTEVLAEVLEIAAGSVRKVKLAVHAATLLTGKSCFIGCLDYCGDICTLKKVTFHPIAPEDNLDA
jgi:hypothetical protein